MIVLVADDDRDSRDRVAVALSSAGYAVKIATTGLEALREIEADPSIRAALLDWTLPDLHTADLLENIHSIAPHLAIVFLVSDDRGREKANEYGVPHALMKPIDFDEMRTILRTIEHSITPQV